jgi:hypothetical protein
LRKRLRDATEGSVAVACDLCGALKHESRRWPNLGPFGFDEVTLLHEVGIRCPEVESTRVLEVDVCPACFREKILPALRKLGLNSDYWES